jgi:hypothetical protein
MDATPGRLVALAFSTSVALAGAACVSPADDVGGNELGASAVACDGVPGWTLGSYSGGAQVASVGHLFSCKPFPYSGWCGQSSAYEPGVGWAWGDAWVDLGACSAGGADAGPGPDAGSDSVCGGRAPIVGAGAPVVDNLELRETLRFDLALLTGSADSSASAVDIEIGGAHRSWPVVQGRFKALVPLSAGCNDLTLRTGGASAEFALAYAPQTNPRQVRPVYILSADEDGTFLAPPGEPNDIASAVERIRLAARMLQTFTAEKMREQGLGRRTFALPTDASGEVIVDVVRSAVTNAQAQSMDGYALYSQFYGEVPLGGGNKVLAIMGMSEYDGATRTATAHAALGGGDLAIFGSTGLHTWARSLDEVVARFSDARVVDPSLLHDDSAGRARFWSNYATGLGAALHEIGHTMSLPHPADPSTVMGRGFDQVNRAFLLVEPPHAYSGGIDPITPGDERGWARSSAVRLRFHRWFALDDVDYAVDVPPTMTLLPDAVRIESAAGVRHIELMVDGLGSGHEEMLGSAPQAFELTLESLRGRFPDALQVDVSAIDSDGNIAEMRVFL